MPLRTIRRRPARSVMSMFPSGRNARAYGCDNPFIGTTRNFGPAIGLPLGPRVELSKTCGPSGSVSRGGAGACWALGAVAAMTVRTAIARDKRVIEMHRVIRPSPERAIDRAEALRVDRSTISALSLNNK